MRGDMTAKDKEYLDQIGPSIECLGQPHVKIINMNLHDESQRKDNLSRYYALCKEFSGLHVTTSCFTVWRNSKKKNNCGKVIPAIAAKRARGTKVFFFDDNLEWEGLEHSPGICNLRDVDTGAFVDFSIGSNGFRKSMAGRHTVIYDSPEYNNILVKANILDAMEDQEYFSKIISRFAGADDQIIVYMDVNSTIVCNDSVQGKDISATLISTMMEFIELKPIEPFTFEWDTFEPIRVEKMKTLKTLVKDITGKDHDAYASFWSVPRCCRFFDRLATQGSICWTNGQPLSQEAFMTDYQQYLTSVGNDISKDGITRSWFNVFARLQAGNHTVVLNSFGVDTRKVVLATLPDEKDVIQITANYELWDERDTTKFQKQFDEPAPQKEDAQQAPETIARVRDETRAPRRSAPLGWCFTQLVRCCGSESTWLVEDQESDLKNHDELVFGRNMDRNVDRSTLMLC